MTKRNLLRYIRLPQLLVFSTIQPVMFVLLFAFVFGGAIKTPVANYIDYLIPGIIAQAVLFGSVQTGVGLAEDLAFGMIDRFRSLPMSRVAILAGRTIADVVRNTFVVLLMAGVGAAIGFRLHTNILDAVGALALAVSLGFAFSWISATIGFTLKNAEAAQVAGFVWIFPLVFASSIFVPVETMPDWLEAFAKVSPITASVNTIRALTLGGTIGDSLWHALAWIGGILIVFIPIAVFRYRRAA